MPLKHVVVEDVTDKDWLFEFLLGLLNSPQWDVSVMGFIDENCAVFDTDDENKLSYTSLHRQFKDLVETLCCSSLAEVGVTVEEFIEALDASKLSPDISKAVYEQLIALDDFVTFKKLMVKRNVELELEAVRALQEQGLSILHDNVNTSASLEVAGGSKEDGEENFVDDEGRAVTSGPLQEAVKSPRGASALERQTLQAAMDANLRELERMDKREEAEQAELEQAIAMSLALVTKHSKRDTQGDSESGCLRDSDNISVAHRPDCLDDKVRQVECKIVGNDGIECRRPQAKDGYAGPDYDEAQCDLMYADAKHSSSSLKKGGTVRAHSIPLPPLSTSRTEDGKGFRPAVGPGAEYFRDPIVEAAGWKLKARKASGKAQFYLGENKRAQEGLTEQISKDETAQRERHLKDLRDRIVSTKRAEREEQASKAKTAVTRGFEGNNNTERKRSSCSIVSRGGDTKATEEGVLVVNGENVEEDFADEQRRSMRVALARRMKHELVQSEHNRLAKVQEDQLADLKDKLCLVEKLRDQNSEKEAEIAQVLRQQQYQRARNVASSTAYAQGNDEDEFTFGERG